jgi:hypothetical protein
VGTFSAPDHRLLLADPDRGGASGSSGSIRSSSCSKAFTNGDVAARPGGVALELWGAISTHAGCNRTWTGPTSGTTAPDDSRVVTGHRGARCLLGAHRSPVAAAYAAVMSDSRPFDRTNSDVVLTALRRTPQVRQFTNEPVTDTDLSAILNVARWSGSSMSELRAPTAVSLHRQLPVPRPLPLIPGRPTLPTLTSSSRPST